jgi:hypothetical protein
MLALGVLGNAAVAGAVKMKDKAFLRYEYYECKCKTAYNNVNGMHICMQLLKMGLGLPPSYSRCILI